MTSPDISAPTPARRPRWRILLPRIAIALAAMLAVLVLLLGAFPVGLARGLVESRLSSSLKTKVHVGAVTRDSVFSFTPLVSVRDVRVAQPSWAGQGDFIRLSSASVRVPIFALLFGHFRPDRVTVDGARIALVRDATGRANWEPDGPHPNRQTSHPTLSDLTVRNTLVVLRDAKRGLMIAGPLTVDAVHGLRVTATGTFRDTPAVLALTGARIVGVDPTAPYPFTATLDSPALAMTANGVMNGVLDTRHFKADIRATAPTLKNLDHLIEAGLFGTQPIDLAGTIRHDGRDWYVDRIGGTVGRSRFVGLATIHKDGIRTLIDARIHASTFDFDDLSDAQGQAAAAARRAATGERVIPPTRIDLHKLWKTDGTLRVRIDRITAQGGTVFRSLAGTLTLDHRVLRVTDLVATLADGRVTGTVKVDHRSGLPKLNTDLYLSGLTLEALIGKPEIISGRVRGRVVLAGQGQTVREALAHADGKASIVAAQGQIQGMVADVLGQNLSGAIGHAIAGPSAKVPLQCFVATFQGTSGVLVPHPLALDTGASVGRGSGRIVLDGETIALTLAGASKSHALLRIADPIRVGGTLSSPTVSVAGLGARTSPPTTGGVLKVLGRSLGQALGLTRTPQSANGQPPVTMKCQAAMAAALG